MCYSSQHKNRASDRDIRNRTLLIFHFSPLFSFSSKSLCHLHRFLCHTFLSLSLLVLFLSHIMALHLRKNNPPFFCSRSLSHRLFSKTAAHTDFTTTSGLRERERENRRGRERGRLIHRSHVSVTSCA